MKDKRLFFYLFALLLPLWSSYLSQASAADIETVISLKSAGRPVEHFELTRRGHRLVPKTDIPVEVSIDERKEGDDEIITLCVKAKAEVYYNIGGELQTKLASSSTDYYLPGFWYHRNMRSPAKAPSMKTSKSWNFREDRLSTPLTSAYDSLLKRGISVMRVLDTPEECVSAQVSGEVMLTRGATSIGYLGMDAEDEQALLTFGYPYMETPKRYIRKLQLVDAVMSFARLQAGEEKRIVWRIHTQQAADYRDFVAQMWQYSFDVMAPKPLVPRYTAEQMKAGLSAYFTQAYVDTYPLKFHSGISVQTATCAPVDRFQLGFCGRVLLNAFNALEYGEQQGNAQLVHIGQQIFDSFLAHGITAQGWLIDDRQLNKPLQQVPHSIRQQSEGIYALLHYLAYEKKHGRKHEAWEKQVRTILDKIVDMQAEDGHFCRKFQDQGRVIDRSGGSTPSATSALVMGYVYFKDKRYLEAAKRSVDYVEEHIISKADYYSSTLDANCEDKEAAIAAVTATYYMAMVSKGKGRKHYIGLCKQAAYFAVSWYYTWDVPFASSQLLGQLDFHTRGWGNVSVENNHVDVFVFELPHILQWLSEETEEGRFAQMREVIYSSLGQLLPTAGRMCGIAKAGYYPEVVQHTTWDYGAHGKGFYHRVFAPGWTVASLWEMYSPHRTVDFLHRK